MTFAHSTEWASPPLSSIPSAHPHLKSSMARPLRVLIVEDNSHDAELLLAALEDAGFAANWVRVDNEADYLAHLSPGLDIVLSDHELPQFNSTRALALLNEQGLKVPFIIVLGNHWGGYRRQIHQTRGCGLPP